MRLLVGIVVLIAAVGCSEHIPGTCAKQGDCLGQEFCDLDSASASFRKCIRADGGGLGDASSGGEVSPAVDGPLQTADAGPTTDGRAAPDVTPVVPDATGSCGRSADCPSDRPICMESRCVQCAAASDCKDPLKPTCAMNACVECMGDAQCAMDPNRPFCVANACVGCAKAAATACATRSAAAPVCGPAGACVQCADAAVHCKEAGKGFCAASKCVGCQDAGVAACKAPTGVCNATSGLCVECTGDAQCTDDANRPFCVANKCAGCAQATASACAMKSPAAAVCGPAGACVECTASSHCSSDPARPICEATKCRRCSGDAECVAKGGPNPGVCMAHQDGRCASEAETIYVQALGCAAGMGTAASPLCSPQDAAPLFTASRRLVVVRGTVPGFAWTVSGPQVSVVGQNGATLAGGALPGVRVSGSDVYGRSLLIAGGVGMNGVGIIAEVGATLRTDTVTVTGNAGGGILLDGARFELRNTTVAGNGPGELAGGISWGGIRAQNVPAGGPARLERVTVKDNKAPGLTCSSAIQGSGVLATGNSTIDVAATCMVTPCTPAGPSCGAP